MNPPPTEVRKAELERALVEFRKTKLTHVDIDLVMKLKECVMKIDIDGDYVAGDIIDSLKYLTMMIIDSEMKRYDQRLLEENDKDLT